MSNGDRKHMKLIEEETVLFYIIIIIILIFLPGKSKSRSGKTWRYSSSRGAARDSGLINRSPSVEINDSVSCVKQDVRVIKLI